MVKKEIMAMDKIPKRGKIMIKTNKQRFCETLQFNDILAGI